LEDAPLSRQVVKCRRSNERATAFGVRRCCVAFAAQWTVYFGSDSLCKQATSKRRGSGALQNASGARSGALLTTLVSFALAVLLTACDSRQQEQSAQPSPAPEKLANSTNPHRAIARDDQRLPWRMAPG